MQRIEVLPCSSYNGRTRINTKSTETESEKLGLEKQRIDTLIERIQKNAILGTVKICKTVLKM